jgi:hypothetical protein
MEEIVHIPVEYRGVEHEFEARLQVWQYGYRFFVPVDGVELMFERDDSGNHRAVVPEGYTKKLPDQGLVMAIAAVLDGVM